MMISNSAYKGIMGTIQDLIKKLSFSGYVYSKKKKNTFPYFTLRQTVLESERGTKNFRKGPILFGEKGASVLDKDCISI